MNYVLDKTFNCDSQIAPGWKRFEGAAGTIMPTSCPATHRCGTHSPGWINGTNPQVEDGEVLRKPVFIGTATAVIGPLQSLSGIAVPILCTNSGAHQLANFGIVVLIKIISCM